MVAVSVKVGGIWWWQSEDHWQHEAKEKKNNQDFVNMTVRSDWFTL